MLIRGSSFVTSDVVDHLINRSNINHSLVRTFADTLLFSNELLSQLTVPDQESPEEKQKVIALLMLMRLVEIAESTFILAAHGVREELRSLFRIFLDAYFLIANVCSDSGFVPIYFQTDEVERLKLMNVALKRDDALFKQLNDYAIAELRNELDQKIRQEKIEAYKSYTFAQNVNCGEIYDSLYRICSASVHSTPRCLSEYAEVDGAGSIRALIHAGNNETIHRVLYDIQYFLIKALRGVCEIFEIPNDDRLSSLEDALKSAMKNAESKGAGYN